MSLVSPFFKKCHKKIFIEDLKRISLWILGQLFKVVLMWGSMRKTTERVVTVPQLRICIVLHYKCECTNYAFIESALITGHLLFSNGSINWNAWTKNIQCRLLFLDVLLYSALIFQELVVSGEQSWVSTKMRVGKRVSQRCWAHKWEFVWKLHVIQLNLAHNCSTDTTL